MPHITVTEIEVITRKALVAHGAAEWIAAEMAQAVAWAEARNNRICGLYYVESYCQQLVSGRVSGTVDPVVTRPLASRIEVDASNGFAQPAFEKALDQSVAAARETGTVNVAIHRAHTCTALGYFTEKAARQGMIAHRHDQRIADRGPTGWQGPRDRYEPHGLRSARRVKAVWRWL